MAPQVIRLADPLPCVAWAGWALCGQPATVGLVELRTLATGHVYDMRPFCAEHAPAPMPRQNRRNGRNTA